MTKIETMNAQIETAIQKLMQIGDSRLFRSAKTLTDALLAADPRLRPRSLDRETFEMFVERYAVERGYLLPRSAAMSLTPRISASRAATVARGQVGARFGMNDGIDDEALDDDDDNADRYDRLADEQVNDRTAKRPGEAAWLESMTPKQRARLADINRRAAPIAQKRRENQTDFILDCMEQGIETDERRQGR